MDRREMVDRAAFFVFVAVSFLGLAVFRVGLGWHVTDPYIEGTVAEAFPPTAWVSVVPAFVVLGALLAFLLYRTTGVRMPGSR